MAGRPRTTFNKLQRERDRQEKQAEKRLRRLGMNTGPAEPSVRVSDDETPAEK